LTVRPSLRPQWLPSIFVSTFSEGGQKSEISKKQDFLTKLKLHKTVRIPDYILPASVIKVGAGSPIPDFELFLTGKPEKSLFKINFKTNFNSRHLRYYRKIAYFGYIYD
jgi:hypothetical protein